MCKDIAHRNGGWGCRKTAVVAWWRKPIRESSEGLKEQGTNFITRKCLFGKTWQKILAQRSWFSLAHDIGTEYAVYFHNFLRKRFGFHEAFQQESVRLSMQRLRNFPILRSDSISSYCKSIALNCRLLAPTRPTISYFFFQAFSSECSVFPRSESI
jgi:hypothetical protein